MTQVSEQQGRRESKQFESVEELQQALFPKMVEDEILDSGDIDAVAALLARRALDETFHELRAHRASSHR